MSERRGRRKGHVTPTLDGRVSADDMAAAITALHDETARKKNAAPTAHHRLCSTIVRLDATGLLMQYSFIQSVCHYLCTRGREEMI